jgi:hypothetical protein
MQFLRTDQLDVNRRARLAQAHLAVHDHFDKVVDWVVRSIAAFLLTGSGLQYLDAASLGRRIFDAYLSELQIRLLNTKPVSGLYGDWGSGLFNAAFDPEPSIVKLVGVLLGLIVLIAHVLFKQDRDKLTRSSSTLPFPLRHYVGSYDLITIGCFFLLLLVLLSRTTAFSLTGFLVLIVVTGAFYLFLHATNIRGGAYFDRLTYFTVLICTLAALVAWPTLYGRNVFDHKFSVVDVSDLSDPGRDQCSVEKFDPGPVMLWNDQLTEEGKRYMEFVQICVKREAGKTEKFHLAFFTSEGRYHFIDRESLRTIVANFVPFASAEEGSAAVENAKQELAGANP